MIDLHAHVLPGLDDGPATWPESIEICRRAEKAGTRTLTAAPHMFNGMYEVTREDILAGLEDLKERLREERLDIEVVPGAEVYVHTELNRFLQEGRVMTLGDAGRYLLLELPSDIMPRGLDRYLFSLQLSGVIPILAHPERNFDVQSHPEALVKLTEAGTLLQVTAGSFFGVFGSRARKCALKLLKTGTAHLVASDAHGIGSRPPLLDEAYRLVRKTLGPDEAEEVFRTRPARILAGKSISLPREGGKVHSGFMFGIGKLSGFGKSKRK